MLAGVGVAPFVTRWDTWVGTSLRQTTDDAYVRRHITPLSTKAEGYVHRAPVSDFQQAAWLNTGLIHDWVGDDFLPSQIVGAFGLAFGITALSPLASLTSQPPKMPSTKI